MPPKVPLVGCVTNSKVSAWFSTSLPASVMGLFEVSSTTPTDCAVALGASSTGLTTTVKLPTAVVSIPVTVFSTLVTPPLSFTDTVSVA